MQPAAAGDESSVMADDEKRVQLILTRDEALVLLDFLLRFNARPDVPFEDSAEKFVLWGLECMLEQQLDEPFRPDYVELVARARKEVRESY